jgi:hypothetical protein
VALGGVLWLRHVRSAVPASAETVGRGMAPAPNVAGQWKGLVKYDWGDSYTETFDFRVAGRELSGAASFLERARGILDGKIDGDQVSFVTKSLTSVGEKTYEDTHYYRGTVDGETIRFSLTIESLAESHVPVDLIVRR